MNDKVVVMLTIIIRYQNTPTLTIINSYINGNQSIMYEESCWKFLCLCEAEGNEASFQKYSFSEIQDKDVRICAPGYINHTIENK